MKSNGRRRFSTSQIRSMRKLYKSEGMGAAMEKFGVSHTTVYRICVSGRLYKDVK
jgi:hypothetical protein